MLTPHLRPLAHAVPAVVVRTGIRTLAAVSSESPRHVAYCSSKLFESIEQSQEMCALSHRTMVAEQLVEEVKLRQSRFAGLDPQAFETPTNTSDLKGLPPSSFGFSWALPLLDEELEQQAEFPDPHELWAALKRSPTECPVSSEVAESMVAAYGTMLRSLPSPVIDVELPRALAREDPRLVVVGDTHGQLLDVLHIFDTHGPPSDSVVYLFNGDIVDRGRNAIEIWLLLIAFKMRFPHSVHVLRGNHENEQMIARPLKMGGGFAEECLAKHSRQILAAFQRVFKLLPLFAVIEREVFVVHGGLFRNRAVDLIRLRTMPQASWRRNYPNPPSKEQMAKGEKWSEEEEILFDAQWADPHFGCGSKQSARGRVAVTFGEDVTQRFLQEAGLALCIRSHRVPQSGRGFELEHSGRLLTLFSASRYGGVLQNHGAVGVLRRADGKRLTPGIEGLEMQTPTQPSLGFEEEEGGSSSSSGMPSSRQPLPVLKRLRLTLVEHIVDSTHLLTAARSATPKGVLTGADGENLAAHQVRKILEQQSREHQVSVLQQAVALVCSERESIWRKCRETDVLSMGLIPRDVLHDLLGDVCGEIDVGGWKQVLECCAPDMGRHVPYGQFLAAPTVRWFHHGTASLCELARATAQAELRIGGLAQLFDSALNGVVTPTAAMASLKRLIPSLQDDQSRDLAKALFGDAASEPASLSLVLDKLADFAEPPELSEAWMSIALKRLAKLVEKSYGPGPLHAALVKFFVTHDTSKSELLTADEFVKGFQHVGASSVSGDAEVPLLHSGRLYKLFEAIDGNGTGTVSFLELLIALHNRPGRTDLRQSAEVSLEGEVAAMLLVHKNAVIRLCRALDPEDTGLVSTANFMELVDALAKVLRRPLSRHAWARFEKELGATTGVPYLKALEVASFEVIAEDWPWSLRSEACE
mmetsp:Transcript_57664/g.122674  ORF Transcript_57664/g.122674 Transcript_57664/m.122674 type:complete len:925 (-) Transcript_57664:394-3168(-)